MEKPSNPRREKRAAGLAAVLSGHVVYTPDGYTFSDPALRTLALFHLEHKPKGKEKPDYKFN